MGRYGGASAFGDLGVSIYAVVLMSAGAQIIRASGWTSAVRVVPWPTTSPSSW